MTKFIKGIWRKTLANNAWSEIAKEIEFLENGKMIQIVKVILPMMLKKKGNFSKICS